MTNKFTFLLNMLKTGEIDLLKANFQIWTKEIVSTPEGERRCYEALHIADERNKRLIYGAISK